MAAGFSIAEVRFRGERVDDAVITFAPGLSVIAGPSNTGKSLVRGAINFVFGASDPMKTVAEAAPYRTILVEVHTKDGRTITFERSWQGGDIKQYTVPAREADRSTPATVLSARHSADDQDNISAVLLSLSGLAGTRLRKNQTGDLRNLSFRNLVEYLLISEERILTELSPIHTASYTDKTFESSLFRALLTGKDDRELITAPPKKDERAHAAGQEEAIARIKDDIANRIPKDGRTEQDLRRRADAIDKRIAEQGRLLQNYRTDLSDLERQRRESEQEHRGSQSRLTAVEANLKRFALLQTQYDSDRKRLESTVEAGTLFADHQEGPCPICGAERRYHQQHAITPEQLEQFTNACRAEADKIHLRQADLKGTIAELETERTALQATLAELVRQRAHITKAFQDILGPSIANIDGDLTELGEERAEITRTLALYEELQRLDEFEQQLPPVMTGRTKKDASFAGLPPNDYEQFATTVQALLQAWSFPELERVTFDTAAEDIVISGKARKDNGKGYRAITYAAFMIGVLLETMRKHLPHPGFVVMDSPLVTYREPDEHIGEGVKDAFYRHLAKSIGDAQVIVLENEEPPEDLNKKIAFTGFSKNRTTGRYGLFPPLKEDEAQHHGADTHTPSGTPRSRSATAGG